MMPGGVKLSAAQKKRDAIIAAAQELFSSRGYEGTSIRDIAVHAGVGHAAVTYHFGHKEELWKSAIGSLVVEYQKELEIKADIIRRLEPEQKYHQLFVMLIRLAASKPYMNRVILQESYGRSWRLDWIIEHLLEPGVRIHQSILGDELGDALRHNPVLMFALIGACTHFFSVAGQAEQMFGVDVFSEEIIEQHVETIRALFAPR